MSFLPSPSELAITFVMGALSMAAVVLGLFCAVWATGGVP